MSDGGGDTNSLTQPPRRRLSFRHINALAIAAVLAASGVVPAADLAFVPLSFVYLHLFSVVAFPQLHPAPDPRVFSARDLRLLGAYVSASGVVSLLLPLAHITDCVLAGDKDGVRVAAPHVFLLNAQIFLEGVIFSWGYSLPVFAFVPIFYNTRRLFTIFDWVAREGGRAKDGHAAARQVLAGRALAVANLCFWGFNLFGFLLPVYLPRVFKRYYSGHNNTTKAKDKSTTR
ncbi:hypothetical protein Cni_G14811 [Canna indica]|uniref:DUF7733 domain-containing protein n=1 Tax=Canna indica TaxID=4628 RepID=A0AAQ3KDH7_9LILI|nr:hypothetical protein Cni_G14811 [Canna indica]